jgi:dihydroorotase
VKALIAGLKSGVIDAIATDHAPHTGADKNCTFEKAAFGISGLETALAVVLSLHHKGDLELKTIISKLTVEPANIIQQRELGTLVPGSPADITVFDPNAQWTVDPSTFASKGKNTPFAGLTLKGKVIATIYGGRFRHRIML